MAAKIVPFNGRPVDLEEPVVGPQVRIEFMAASLDLAAKCVLEGKMDIARNICATVVKMIDELENR